MEAKDVKTSVREHYANIARGQASAKEKAERLGGCCGQAPPVAISRAIGYSEREMKAVPEGANLGLGCGNPLAFAALKQGEVVVDLGSGAGFDCFLAAQRVGPSGRVIGVDMTHEMLARARENAARDGVGNVEFRLGEIENLPVADGTADMVISNCVINLSTDKPRVFREALRVLKPGGRLMVSDLVLARPLPASIARSVAAYAGCVAGAMLKADYLAAIRAAGFADVEVLAEATYPIGSSNPDASELAVLGDPSIGREDVRAAAEAVVSVKVAARRPD
ncbi:MAG TPA: arsenite methyltransferase [Thermoanaerobaculaceae bacterium]|nr:arsenite methyltransferase [Thermoanaerobaculaceae bacterium]